MKSRLFIVMMISHSSYIFLVILLGLKVVGLVVLSFGCGVVERIGRCCILLWVLRISCSFSPLLCFLVGACYRAAVWVNLAVCLLRSVRIKKINIKCGAV